MDEEDEPDYRSIKLMDKSDLFEMVKTYISAYEGMEEYADIGSEDSALRYLLKYFRFEDVEMYKLLVNNEFSGFIFIEEKNRSIEIHEFAVKPEFQGYKVGKELLEMVNYLKEKRGIDKVELWVGMKNNKAKKIYRKFGFVEELNDGKWEKLTYIYKKNSICTKEKRRRNYVREDKIAW